MKWFQDFVHPPNGLGQSAYGGCPNSEDEKEEEREAQAKLYIQTPDRPPRGCYWYYNIMIL